LTRGRSCEHKEREHRKNEEPIGGGGKESAVPLPALMRRSFDGSYTPKSHENLSNLDYH
jgi:hypothetical protein